MRLVTNNYNEFARACLENPDARVRVEGDSIVFLTGLNKAFDFGMLKEFRASHMRKSDFLAQKSYEVAHKLADWRNNPENEAWKTFGSTDDPNQSMATPEGVKQPVIKSLLRDTNPYLYSRVNMFGPTIAEGTLMKPLFVSYFDKLRRYEQRVAFVELDVAAETRLNGNIYGSCSSLASITESDRADVPVFCMRMQEGQFRDFIERRKGLINLPDSFSEIDDEPEEIQVSTLFSGCASVNDDELGITELAEEDILLVNPPAYRQPATHHFNRILRSAPESFGGIIRNVGAHIANNDVGAMRGLIGELETKIQHIRENGVTVLDRHMDGRINHLLHREDMKYMQALIDKMQHAIQENN